MMTKHRAKEKLVPETSSSRLLDAWNAFICFWTIPMWTLALMVGIYIASVLCTRDKLVRNLLLLYIPYCLLDRSPQNGRGHGKRLEPRLLERLRHNFSFHTVAQYFPISLCKTVDLPATQSYIFCYHPHGVISMGANAALSTNGCNFDQVFPGIRRLGITLNIMFCLPVFREWLMVLGYISANKESLARELKAGNSLVLVTGGATEALLSHPDKMSFIGKNRRGFCRLAVENNANLVPCLGFGENRVFATFIPEKKSVCWIGTLQRLWCRYAKFSVPILTSLLPVKTPIDVVVGAPVAPRSPGNRTNDWDPVEDLHERYWKAVQKLYDEHKDDYGYSDIPLQLL